MIKTLIVCVLVGWVAAGVSESHGAEPGAVAAAGTVRSQGAEPDAVAAAGTVRSQGAEPDTVAAAGTVRSQGAEPDTVAAAGVSESQGAEPDTVAAARKPKHAQPAADTTGKDIIVLEAIEIRGKVQKPGVLLVPRRLEPEVGKIELERSFDDEVKQELGELPKPEKELRDMERVESVKKTVERKRK